MITSRKLNRFYLISPLLLQTVIWPATRFLLRFFLHLKVRGLENLKGLPPGVIFAANHTSELDAILVPASLPFLSRFMPIFYVSREKSFYKKSGWRKIFYGGFLFKCWGAHAAQTGLNDYEKSLQTHIELLNRNKSVLIFPEGKKTSESDTQNVRGGVVFLSQATDKPIVPISIGGVLNLSLWDFLLRKKHAKIIFGSRINAKNLITSHSSIDIDSFKRAAETLMSEIKILGQVEQEHGTMNFEVHGPLTKIFRVVSVPALNLIPGQILQLLMKKTSRDAGTVVKHGGTTTALEAMYTRHHRRPFSRGVFQGIADFFWHHAISQPKALRNRLRSIENLLKEEVLHRLKNDNEKIQILNVAGGSSRAIIHMLADLKKTGRNISAISITTVDRDERALELGKQIATDYGVFENFHWIKGNIRDLNELIRDKSFDIIEMVGLLDYFSDTSAISLLTLLKKHLKIDSCLITANIMPNKEMSFIKKTGWPSMYYRTPADLKKIVVSAGFFGKNDTLTEPLRIHTIIRTYLD